MKEHLFDKRVVQRALQEGLIDQAAYQRMLDALPDLSHKLQAADEDDDIDDEDDEDDDDEGDEDAEAAAADVPRGGPTYSSEL